MMNPMKRHRLNLCRLLTAMILSGAASLGLSQEFPGRPLTIVVPFAAGGPTDVIARTLAERMRVPLKQPVMVENRVGAASLIALNYVRSRPADGYTMVMVSTTITTLPSLNAAANYSVARDFTSIAGIGRATMLLVVNREAGIDSFAALMAQAKANPGRLNWGLASTLGFDHLAAERIMRQAGFRVETIGYQGDAPMTTDLIANRVQVAISAPGLFTANIAAGKLTPLAVTSASRWPDNPGVPTMAEVGLKDLVIESWFGVFGPAGMPADVVNVLNREISAALGTPEVGARLRAIGYLPMPLGPAQIAELAGSSEQSWAQVIKAMGIKPQ